MKGDVSNNTVIASGEKHGTSLSEHLEKANECKGMVSRSFLFLRVGSSPCGFDSQEYHLSKEFLAVH